MVRKVSVTAANCADPAENTAIDPIRALSHQGVAQPWPDGRNPRGRRRMLQHGGEDRGEAAVMSGAPSAAARPGRRRPAAQGGGLAADD